MDDLNGPSLMFSAASNFDWATIIKLALLILALPISAAILTGWAQQKVLPPASKAPADNGPVFIKPRKRHNLRVIQGGKRRHL